MELSKLSGGTNITKWNSAFSWSPQMYPPLLPPPDAAYLVVPSAALNCSQMAARVVRPIGKEEEKKEKDPLGRHASADINK